MPRVRGIKKPHPLGSVASRSGVAQFTAASGFTAADGVKISELPEAGAANDTDQLEVNQGGTSRRVTVGQLTDLVSGAVLTVNVRQFGAVGDGVADDTVAIQAAIDFVFARGLAGAVHFPTGTYKVSASSLDEMYDNIGDLSGAPASDQHIILRRGVSLIGQPDCSARIHCSDRTKTGIAMIAPVGCSIEGLEVYSTWTTDPETDDGAAAGIVVLGTEGGADRSCHSNVWRNLYIHNFGGYGLALQNGTPVRCRIEDVDIYYTGADALDLKCRGTLSTYPVGNTVNNVTIRRHGERVDGSAGIDVRGVWHMSGVSVTDFGHNAALSYVGVRFRQTPEVAPNDHMDWPDAGRYSTLTNFEVKPAAAAAATVIHGVYSASDDVHVSDGTAEDCLNNFMVTVGSEGRAALDCTFIGCTSINARQYGFNVASNAPVYTTRTRIIGFASKGSTTAGIFNNGINTQIIGAALSTETTPITTSAASLATQILINGPGSGSIQIGGGINPAVRLGVGAPITGNANSYGALVSAAVQSDVSTAYGYGTSLTPDTGVTTNIRHFSATQAPVTGATLTAQYGFYAHSSMDDATNNYGFFGQLPAAANCWNLYMSGAAVNYMAGNLGVGAGINAPTAVVHIAASSTARASLCIAHGAAPTTPVNGDMWTTTAGVFIRINGVTKTFTTT